MTEVTKERLPREYTVLEVVIKSIKNSFSFIFLTSCLSNIFSTNSHELLVISPFELFFSLYMISSFVSAFFFIGVFVLRKVEFLFDKNRNKFDYFIIYNSKSNENVKRDFRVWTNILSMTECVLMGIIFMIMVI